MFETLFALALALAIVATVLTLAVARRERGGVLDSIAYRAVGLAYRLRYSRPVLALLDATGLASPYAPTRVTFAPLDADAATFTDEFLAFPTTPATATPTTPATVRTRPAFVVAFLATVGFALVVTFGFEGAALATILPVVPVATFTRDPETGARVSYPWSNETKRIVGTTDDDFSANLRAAKANGANAYEADVIATGIRNEAALAAFRIGATFVANSVPVPVAADIVYIRYVGSEKTRIVTPVGRPTPEGTRGFTVDALADGIRVVNPSLSVSGAKGRITTLRNTGLIASVLLTETSLTGDVREVELLVIAPDGTPRGTTKPNGERTAPDVRTRNRDYSIVELFVSFRGKKARAFVAYLDSLAATIDPEGFASSDTVAAPTPAKASKPRAGRSAKLRAKGAKGAKGAKV